MLRLVAGWVRVLRSGVGEELAGRGGGREGREVVKGEEASSCY